MSMCRTSDDPGGTQGVIIRLGPAEDWLCFSIFPMCACVQSLSWQIIVFDPSENGSFKKGGGVFRTVPSHSGGKTSSDCFRVQCDALSLPMMLLLPPMSRVTFDLIYAKHPLVFSTAPMFVPSLSW
jgi:hypothetical protein